MLDEIPKRRITFNNGAYPPLLKSIPRPPSSLYVKGNAGLLQKVCFAIVGTRKASGEGREFARQIAFELAGAEFVIVSGLAQGIDGSAHQGALEAGGKTIGVLGSSLEDRFFFPRENRKLAKEILEKGGAIVSEYEKNQAALRPCFIERNRIIAGLSVGVLVVEAPMKSGALSSAAFARKTGRLVFAAPGSPFVRNSAGTNWLIKTGAFLTQDARDILDVLQKKRLYAVPKRTDMLIPSGGFDDLHSEERAILNVLKDGPCHIDKIIQTTTIEASAVLSILTELEIRGKVTSIGGGNYMLSNT